MNLKLSFLFLGLVVVVTPVVNQRQSYVKNMANVQFLLQKSPRTNIVGDLASSDAHLLGLGLRETPFEQLLELALKALFANAAAANVSSQCLNDTEAMVDAVKTKQSWSLSMLDATGKPSAGILYAGLSWLGNFDECLNITDVKVVTNTSTSEFDAQYCLTTISPKNVDPFLAALTSVRLGTCLPGTCNSKDTQGLLTAVLSLLKVNTTASNIYATCPARHLELTTAAIGVIIVLVIFGVLLAIATFIDVYLEWKIQHETKYPPKIEVNPENGSTVFEDDSETSPLLAGDFKHKIIEQEQQNSPLCVRLLLVFSVYTNLKKMFSTKTSSDNLGAIHGIRFLSMTWVILGHTIFFAILVPPANIGWFYIEAMKKWTFQAIFNASVSVDSFFLLSGLLMCYLFMKEIERVGSPWKINWFMFYFHRYWRLTPVYMFVIMVYVPLGQYFSDGPAYPQTADFDPNCKKYWWTNLLYVNNLVGSKEMCMGWSWYLANDMQFYWISPLVLIPYFFHWAAGTAMVIIFCLVNFLTVGIISTRDHVGSTLTTGAFDTIYIKPWCRVAPYMIGVAFGYILAKTKRKVTMPWYAVVIGWCTAAACCLSPLYGLYDTYNGKINSQATNSTYQALFRSSWSLGLGWVCFACLTGYGGVVNTILSWKALIPLSRLTYCAYLVHPVIMEVVYSSVRQPYYLNNIFIIYYFCGQLIMAYMVALVTSLTFESPMIGLERILLRKKKTS